MYMYALEGRRTRDLGWEGRGGKGDEEGKGRARAKGTHKSKNKVSGIGLRYRNIPNLYLTTSAII